MNDSAKTAALRTANARGPERVVALDGLRGAAAVVVVVFHYLCLLHPQSVPMMSEDAVWISYSPLNILWNGPFAVSIFFVLSGFVMAAAAERYHDQLFANAVTRYLRLAVPITVSVLFAWFLLTAFPSATRELAIAMEEPSPWLAYTYQDDIPGIGAAIFDGLVGNFVHGSSDFNNVLWAMRIELVGSLGIFAIYWLTERHVRLLALGVTGLVIIKFVSAHYLGFVAGACLFEAYSRGLLRPGKVPFPCLALLAGIVLGAPGPGTAERWGLPDLPERLTIGMPNGFFPVLAATLIHYGVLGLKDSARALGTGMLRWCGRVSFSLYLVHVPILYTLIAAAYLHAGLPSLVLAVIYAVLVFGLAHGLSRLVDEPNLRMLKQLRANLRPWEPFGGVSRLR